MGVLDAVLTERRAKRQNQLAHVQALFSGLSNAVQNRGSALDRILKITTIQKNLRLVTPTQEDVAKQNTFKKFNEGQDLTTEEKRLIGIDRRLTLDDLFLQNMGFPLGETSGEKTDTGSKKPEKLVVTSEQKDIFNSEMAKHGDAEKAREAAGF